MRIEIYRAFLLGFCNFSGQSKRLKWGDLVEELNPHTHPGETGVLRSGGALRGGGLHGKGSVPTLAGLHKVLQEVEGFVSGMSSGNREGD